MLDDAAIIVRGICSRSSRECPDKLIPAQHSELTQAAAGDAAKKKTTGEPRMSIAELREKLAAEQRAQAARKNDHADEAS